MLKAGLATVYEAKSGAEFGDLEQDYRSAEAAAKARRKGMWVASMNTFESPREYKTRTALEEERKQAQVARAKPSLWSSLVSIISRKL